MTMDAAGRESWVDTFHQYRDDIITKMKKGETEEAVFVGGAAFTQTQWKKVLESVDRQLDDVKQEQEQRFEGKLQAAEDGRSEAARIFDAAVSGKSNPAQNLRSAGKTPYAALAKDGVIEYNGVTFVCDERTNSICLGDVGDKKNTLTISLSEGGCLKVNRDNLDELQKAIGMFSPEDVNRILRAIAKDNKAREMQQELDNEKNDFKQIKG